MPTITTVDATWDTGVTMDAAELRRADTAMFLGDGSVNGVRGGVVRHGDTSLAVAVNGSDQVTVQPGAFVVPAATGLGVYRGALQTVTSAVALSARNATNPRIDLIAVQVTGTNATIKTIDGTPGSSPSAPALPAQHIELARVTVPATGGGAVTVDSTWRAYASGLGGALYVETSARLPGSGNIKGQRAVSLATGFRYTWDGAAWISEDEFTPFTLSIVNMPLNAGATSASYKRYGKDVRVQFVAVASGVVGGTMTLELPFNAKINSGTSNQAQMVGAATAQDASAGSAVPVFLYLSSLNRVGILTTAGQLGAAAQPFTWAVGDTLAGSFSYEMA